MAGREILPMERRGVAHLLMQGVRKALRKDRPLILATPGTECCERPGPIRCPLPPRDAFTAPRTREKPTTWPQRRSSS